MTRGLASGSGRLKVFTNASATPLLSRLWAGVKHGTSLSAEQSRRSMGGEDRAISDSHYTACKARIAPKRCSTQRTIMSPIISPEMPAGVAIQLITAVVAVENEPSRTTSPFSR